VLELYGRVAKDLSIRHYDRGVVGSIVALNNGLKVYGLQLEQTHKDVLDKYQVFLRTACRDGTLDLVARLQLLEIIELRAMKWKPNENVTNYYKHKLLQVEQCDVNYNHDGGPQQQLPRPTSLNANASEFQPVSTAKFLASASANLSSLLSVNPASGDQALPTPPVPPGQVMVSSGKFDRPSRVPGKQPQQQFKDEVVIRNADSGKVETGAKERLVQIMGPDEGRIKTAKGLIEETIQRNKTPEPEVEQEQLTNNLDNNNEPNCKTMMTQGSGGTYSYTVEVGEESIKILGGNADLVRVAKQILDQHFAGKLPNNDVGNSDDSGTNKTNEANGTTSNSGPIIRYERRQLLAFSNSPFCHQEPINWSKNWDTLKQENPGLARNVKRNSSSATSSGGEEQQQQVGNEEAEEGEFEKDFYKPTPDLFLRKTPSFPDGFVLPYPRTTSYGKADQQATNSYQKQQQTAGSHLDRLFTGAGSSEAAAAAAGHKLPGANTLQSLLSNAKVWDETTQKWVPESRLTRN